LLAKTASSSIDLSCMPRIWFGGQRDGESRHFQDWEGHIFRRAERQAAVIALSTHMLSSEERNTLQSIIDQQVF
jgi:hypothetical protein